MAKEQALQKQILAYLKDEGYYTVKTVVSNRSGVPDIIACSPSGRFVAIEVKAPGKLLNTSPLQSYNLGLIQGNSGIAFVADQLCTVKNKLKNIQ